MPIRKSKEHHSTQIDHVHDNIILKESMGKDATFERELLKTWSLVRGWGHAKQALETCGDTHRRPHNRKLGVSVQK